MSDPELIKISGCQNPIRKGDVIFVHGLGGRARGTWHSQKQNNDNNFWPAWLGKDLPNVGIWCLGYEVEPLNWKGATMPLVDRATNILALLDTYDIGNRPLIFITYSLGGLLVKQMLRHAQDLGTPEWQAIVEQTKGIVFLSTPHSGSEIASWINYIGRILSPSISVEELEAHHPQLRQLNLVYRNHQRLSQIPMQVYCEKQKTNGILVVNETSADPGISGVIPIPVDHNHISICKPKSKDSLISLRVKRFVEKCLQVSPQSSLPLLEAKTKFEIKQQVKDTKQKVISNDSDLQEQSLVDYRQLSQFLAEGEWKEADEETTRVLLEITNRQQSGWLRSQDIGKITCSDLLTIDQLWTRYSTGKFGFTAQRQIWLGVGGQPGQFKGEIFYRFGDHVGWRVNSNWLETHSKFAFKLSAPRGHLPSLAFPSKNKQVDFGLWKDSFGSFLTHWETCSSKQKAV
ncbi:MAG: hypothetical protein F6K21_25565 [Symploca sp. SIO2D2]|nr:hypothetical protein [Symploca sp. SIO2D2]